MIIGKYSIGIGDRFARQGEAQLQAVADARRDGIDVVPVWNKSYREHAIIGSKPADTRAAADAAVRSLGWKAPYHVDADHIGIGNVDFFMDACDFFTLDVAENIGRPAPAADIDAFTDKFGRYAGELKIDGINPPFRVSKEDIRRTALRYLGAVQEAKRIYDRIESAKGEWNFITEISMDETDAPQTPVELFFILAAAADAGIPVQTIAPKFSGRFNKGVDYSGDPSLFEEEFNDDLLVVARCVREFGLPETLKLSIHSGSDKFSIYGAVNRALKRHGSGLHVKTAGTTWLEEAAGLALSEGEGLAAAVEIYTRAYGRFDELCVPYASVIDIRKERLPKPETAAGWNGSEFARALIHEPGGTEFNADFRQLLHVGYKIAAEMGERFTKALEDCRGVIARQVTDNLYRKHIVPIFK